MKKIILMATVALAATPALASKSRVNALGDSRQVNDFQQAFERPYLFNNFGTMVTYEWGTTSAAVFNAGQAVEKTNPKAEGGFLVKGEDMVYGLYLGRLSNDFGKIVTQANGGTDFDITTTANNRTEAQSFLYEQNALNLIYASKAGDLSYGVTFKYSNGQNEVADKKVNSMGLAAGVTNGTWEVEAVIGLAGKTEANAINQNIESKGNNKIGFGYNINETMHVYADYKMAKSEGKVGVDATVENTAMNIGFINTLVKNEDANVFYGVRYSMNTEDIKADPVKVEKTESTTLPVWIGVEANASSWMVLRGFVSQSILLNETKVTTAAATKKADIDAINVGAGVGLKLGKGMLDASFNTTNAGHLSFGNGAATADRFLTNVAYTYNF